MKDKSSIEQWKEQVPDTSKDGPNQLASMLHSNKLKLELLKLQSLKQEHQETFSIIVKVFHVLRISLQYTIPFT